MLLSRRDGNIFCFEGGWLSTMFNDIPMKGDNHMQERLFPTDVGNRKVLPRYRSITCSTFHSNAKSIKTSSIVKNKNS